MIEITWRYDPADATPEYHPPTPAAARALLDEGNAMFAGLGQGVSTNLVIPVSAYDLGLSGGSESAPPQEPFVAMLACADARVPPELVFMQSANDAFVVRVAGNVLGGECVGSIDYAITHLPSLHLLAVVGHTGCGAVAAAVDCFLEPATYLSLSAELPLRSVVDSIMAEVNGSAVALRRLYGDDVVSRPGFRAALIDTTVVLNAAVGADALRTLLIEHIGDSLDVAFGVYDLSSRRVGVPRTGSAGWLAGLSDAPHGSEFPPFVIDVAGSDHVRALLDTSSGAH